MRYQSDLTTVEAVSRQLVKANPGTVGTPDQAQYDDLYDYLADIIPEVSDYIETTCGVSFVPYKEDKIMYFHDIRLFELWDAKTRLLKLPDEVLSVNTVTWNETLLAATDFRTHPTDEYAGWGLLFNPSTSLPWNTEFNAGVELSATWGWHLNASQMYSTVETITINDTTTSITVADSTRYEVRGYLRCENELMQITDKPNTTVLTVLRGVNGHTAAAHSARALQIYNVVRGVQHVATRMSAYLYQKRLDVGGTVQIGESAFLLDALPVTVKEMMKMRQVWSFGHI